MRRISQMYQELVSVSMEQDVIVEGFLQIIGMPGLVYRRLIADGDIRVYRKMLCRVGQGDKGKELNLKDRMMRLRRTAVISAIECRKNQNEDKYYLSTEELGKDVLNSQFHVLESVAMAQFERENDSVAMAQFERENDSVAMAQFERENDSVAIAQFERENDAVAIAQFERENDSVAIAQFERENDSVAMAQFERENDSVAIAQFERENDSVAIAQFERENDSVAMAQFERENDSVAMAQFERENDSVAITQFERENPGIVVKRSGLIVDDEYIFLGVSPDGFIGDDQIIEIMCPSSAISMPPLDALAKCKIKHLEMKDRKPQLKLSHNYIYEEQEVLHISRRKTCNFVVWTAKVMVSLRIQRDKDFRENNMITKLLAFFYDYLLLEIIDPRYPRNMPIRELRK
ncbi:hypothetical protein PR048_020914 [Dryococelus australis]|uniref:DM3 domain-containing protein n=1 Tax=Dryococelus australis TaxID=614101 RepID=A0ABQ9GWR7_9NEOP|nr:hypothetical protein PR048_020914 [Dryococelus australis]